MATDGVTRAEELLDRVRADPGLLAAIKAAPDAVALDAVLARAGYGDVQPSDVAVAARLPRSGDDSGRLTEDQLEQVVGGVGGPSQLSPAAASHLMQLILVGLVPGESGF